MEKHCWLTYLSCRLSWIGIKTLMNATWSIVMLFDPSREYIWSICNVNSTTVHFISFISTHHLISVTTWQTIPHCCDPKRISASKLWDQKRLQWYMLIEGRGLKVALENFLWIFFCVILEWMSRNYFFTKIMQFFWSGALFIYKPLFQLISNFVKFYI